jgi:phosphoglycolate phosphatase-like HAD superfamily hydrolase
MEYSRINTECALLDIDGVLIDVKNSYNKAIKKTVDFILQYITRNPKLKNIVTDDIILRFRQTGGFNNDVDTCYAIILGVTASPKKDISYVRRFLLKLAKNMDETGIASVEEKISASSPSHLDIRNVKEVLFYPAPVGTSFLATVFDEIFYGPELFKKRHYTYPKYCFDKPLIDNDKLIVTQETIRTLWNEFDGNVSVISGRSKLAAEYSLKPVFNIFNQNACVFLEDERRDCAKPNPYSIMKSMKIMKARTAIYAGDSIEDLIMSKKAHEEEGLRISFIGVYGCSTKPMEIIKLFRAGGAAAIIQNINQLPNALNKVLAQM